MNEVAVGTIPPGLLWGSFGVIVVAVVAPWFVRSRPLQRRIYWSGWVIGAMGIAVAVSYREGLRGFFITLVVVPLFGVLMAVQHSSHLKIGGRIIAIDRENRRPDPTDGDGAPEQVSTVPLTAAEVRAQRFSKPVGRVGYDPQQVDAFLERIAEHLDGQGDLSTQDVRSVTFGRPSPFVRGYSPDEVDGFLDAVVETFGGGKTTGQ